MAKQSRYDRGVYRRRFRDTSSQRAQLWPGVGTGTVVLNPSDYPPAAPGGVIDDRYFKVLLAGGSL